MTGDRYNRGQWTRRELLREIVAAAAVTPLAGLAHFFPQEISGAHPGAHPAAPAGLESPKPFSPQDEAFLQELEAANFRYFWEQASPETGIVRDRCNVRVAKKNDLGSIAATGFGLTALCIGEKRGFITHAEARDRVL